VSARITEWRLSSSDLQSDLDRGVTIVRTKDTVVGAPTGSTDDEVIKTMVKGKIHEIFTLYYRSIINDHLTFYSY
jgi:hypothetical protein